MVKLILKISMNLVFNLHYYISKNLTLQLFIYTQIWLLSLPHSYVYINTCIIVYFKVILTLCQGITYLHYSDVYVDLVSVSFTCTLISITWISFYIFIYFYSRFIRVTRKVCTFHMVFIIILILCAIFCTFVLH